MSSYPADGGGVPCVLFEDEHLLAVNKPAGISTHAPAPLAPHGLYEWLRHRHPRWANLAIIHRLDKETSGVILFSKSALANRSLTEQFTRRVVRKKYVFLTADPGPGASLRHVSFLARAGNRHISRPSGPERERAITQFATIHSAAGRTEVSAEPLTGRTHQIRVHAAELGFPILGDELYGGRPAPRVFLHSAELQIRHPATSEQMVFYAPPDFAKDPRLALREALIDPGETTAFRICHGGGDGFPGIFADKLGDYLLIASAQNLSSGQVQAAREWQSAFGSRAVYHKLLQRLPGLAEGPEASPKFLFGEPAPEGFFVRENSARFGLSFQEGYSIGLFFDQRENRRRFLVGYIAPGFDLFWQERRTCEVLNTFSYTCGFSVCAALAGARTTSLDLSKKHLEWGKRNFAANGLDPAAHDFIFGDVFEWLKRLQKKSRRFGVIILDPPTFSRSKSSGRFQVEKDLGKLIHAALPLLEPHGVILAASNSAQQTSEAFLEEIRQAVDRAGRTVSELAFIPQPPDFPATREERAYFKSVFLRAG